MAYSQVCVLDPHQTFPTFWRISRFRRTPISRWSRYLIPKRCEYYDDVVQVVQKKHSLETIPVAVTVAERVRLYLCSEG